jgi:DNA-directed RNA polymerase specialized sigma24 family protein
MEAGLAGAAADRLAHRYQQGDRAALAALHAAVEPVLRAAIARVARQSLPAALQLADLHQESWLLLAELARRWRPRPGIPFAAYLGRVFPWALARYLRSQAPARRSRTHAEYSWTHARLLAALDLRAAPTDGDWDIALDCAALLAQIEPWARAAVWLHVVECRPFAEVARLLGVPRATAFDLYRRGLASLRRAA